MTDYIISVNGTDYPSFSGSLTEGTIEGLSSITNYTFSIRAKNIFGSGPLSTLTNIQTYGVPSKIGPIVISETGTKVKIDWPDQSTWVDNGSPILSF